MLRHRYRSPIRTLLVVLLLLGLVPSIALASPETAPVSPAAEQSIAVEVVQPTPSVTTDGMLALEVGVTTAAPAEYLEVRLRLRSPSGRLVYQKTEVRSNLSAGRHGIAYEYDLSTSDLEQGRYPIEVRVLATDADPTTVASRLLVVDPDTPALPVAVAVVITGVPSVTMAGRFSRDPAEDTRFRDDVAFLTQLALSRDEPLSFALPPVLVEQAARVAAGYETTAGVVVPATDDVPVRYARMLTTLRSAVDTGTVDLIDVPYALPSLAGLAGIDAPEDVDLHWTQTDAVDALVFGSSAEPVAAYMGEALDDPSAATLDGRGVACVLAPPSAVRSDDATAAPGCYTIDASTVKVLVTDEEVAAGAHLGAEAFYDALFDHLEGDDPVVVMFQIGPGGSHNTLDVQHALDWIADAPWLVTGDLAGLSRRSDAAPATLTGADGDIDPKYWADVAESRASTLAYREAVGSQDPDAALALRAVLAAESSLLAGGDESAQAEGRARAGEALDFVTSQFALIRLDATDVTLSGSSGDVPLTLVNDTGKPMMLTLDASSSTANSTVASQEIVAQPTQTFLTLPVDLGNSLADELLVTVRAGDVTVAETAVRVRASYVDRLATVLMVVIVLAVLLIIIRRRVSRPVADTIVDDPERHRRSAGDE